MVGISGNNNKQEMYVNRVQLGDMNRFKYLGATFFQKWVLQLRRLHQDRNDQDKQVCYHSYPTLRMWGINPTDKVRIQAFENKCLRKLLQIPYMERKTHDIVRNTVAILVGHQKQMNDWTTDERFVC